MLSTVQPHNQQYASFWQRLMANICDRLILAIIPLMGLYYLLQAKDFSDLFYRLIVGFFLIYLPSLIFNIFYYTWFLNNSGATLGKQIWGIKVVDEDGNFLSLWMAFFREFVAKTVSNVPFYLGFLWMIKEKDSLTWHDMFAGSYVIKDEAKWNSLLVTLVLIAAIALFFFAIASQIPHLISLFTLE